MNTLPPTWITDGTPDFEYKKYILLAYLQQCKEQFDQTRLYPPLAELIEHFRSLKELRQHIEQLETSFPKELNGLDLSSASLQYSPFQLPEDTFQTVNEIIDFALPSLQNAIHEGKDIYELVERHIEIAPVGLVPLYKSEGFLLLNQDQTHEVHVYQYKHSVIVGADGNFQSLMLNYVYSEARSIVNNIEQIKLNITRKFNEWPNPATFFCLSKLHVPLTETLLPVTKRLLVKNIMAA